MLSPVTGAGVEGAGLGAFCATTGSARIASAVLRNEILMVLVIWILLGLICLNLKHIVATRRRNPECKEMLRRFYVLWKYRVTDETVKSLAGRAVCGVPTGLVVRSIHYPALPCRAFT